MKPVSSIVFSLYRETPEHGPWIVACLEGAWPKLVGPKLSAACRPARWQDGRLIVEVLDPAWLPALESMSDKLLARVRETAGNEVTRIVFELRP